MSEIVSALGGEIGAALGVLAGIASVIIGVWGAVNAATAKNLRDARNEIYAEFRNVGDKLDQADVLQRYLREAIDGLVEGVGPVAQTASPSGTMLYLEPQDGLKARKESLRAVSIYLTGFLEVRERRARRLMTAAYLTALVTLVILVGSLTYRLMSENFDSAPGTGPGIGFGTGGDTGDGFAAGDRGGSEGGADSKIDPLLASGFSQGGGGDAGDGATQGGRAGDDGVNTGAGGGDGTNGVRTKESFVNPPVPIPRPVLSKNEVSGNGESPTATTSGILSELGKLVSGGLPLGTENGGLGGSDGGGNGSLTGFGSVSRGPSSLTSSGTLKTEPSGIGGSGGADGGGDGTGGADTGGSGSGGGAD
ncbi:MAG: hypothetical protein RLN70_11610 [Rhodospirillaceae bacterium]